MNYNRLFVVFLVILAMGNIIAGASGAWLGYYFGSDQPYTNPDLNLYEKLNFLDTMGALFIDSFFGLLPNFFYSIYKTKIDKSASEISVKYFLYNYGIIFLFFVVIFSLALASSQWINIILILEVIYTFNVFLLTIYTLRDIRSRVKRVLLRYFTYFSFYMITLIARASLAFFLRYNPRVIKTHVQADGYQIVDTVHNANLTMMIVLFLKELKFGKKEGDKSKESSGTKTTELSQQ